MNMDFVELVARFGGDRPPIWELIEPYIDIESLIALSRTSPALHSVIVDAASGKLKCSAVKIEHEAQVTGQYEGGERNWQTAPVRIKNYSTNVLNAIHWPSVRDFRMGFPPELSTSWDNIDDEQEGCGRVRNAHTVQLPLLANVVHQASASNLEELVIDVNALIEHEGKIQASYRMLGEGLSRCRSLKRLTIFNQLVEKSGHSWHSGALLAALAPVIRANADTLEAVTVLCGDLPAGSDHPEAGREFFEAILRLPHLRRLEMQLLSVYCSLLNALIDASRNVGGTSGTNPSEALEKVWVTAPHATHVTPSSIGPFLSLLRGLPSLQELHLDIPRSCWDAQSFAQLNHVLRGKPLLKFIVLNFHESDDDSEEALDCIEEFLRERDSLTGHYIKLSGIGYVDEDSEPFGALQYYRANDGESCLQPARRDDEGVYYGWSFFLNRCAVS